LLEARAAGDASTTTVEKLAGYMIEFTNDLAAIHPGFNQAKSQAFHRKAVRQFLSGELAEDVMRKAIEDAYSPTAKNKAGVYVKAIRAGSPGAQRGAGRASRQSLATGPGESQRHP
jgi:hypothetical protein